MNRDDFLNRFQKVPIDVYQNRSHAEPLVSVCVQTYQHVSFIKDCINGILMQRTDFPIEILLGEDASTDGTREICINYAEKYPEKIRLFLHHRENNIKINGMPTGRFNFMYNLLNARGKYIALCEGDDFWIDKKKLQKQIELVESNPGCIASFHNAIIKYDNEKTKDELFHKSVLNDKIYIEDILASFFIPTCSVLFKAKLFNNFPDWFMKGKVGDWPLHILNAQHGYFGYLKDTMSVYRVHDDGRWTQLDRENMMIELNFISKSINSYLNYRYKNILNPIISERSFKLAFLYHEQRKRLRAIFHAFEAIKYRPSKLKLTYISKFILLQLLRMIESVYKQFVVF